MDEIVQKIEELRGNGWTLASLADELGVHRDTAYGWIARGHSPANPKLVSRALDTLLKRKPPPRRRYPGTHHLQRKSSKSGANPE